MDGNTGLAQIKCGRMAYPCEGVNVMPEPIEAKMDTSPDLFSVVDQVVTEGERVRIKVAGREVAIISLEDLEFLEDVENDLDLLAGLKALHEVAKDKLVIPWEEILANLKRDHQSESGTETD